MTIALDYDDTYTADTDLWDRFIEDARSRGHRVFIVTARRDTEENRKEVRTTNGTPVYFTGLSPKKWFMEQGGVKVDIWIDDSPEVILHGH